MTLHPLYPLLTWPPPTPTEAPCGTMYSTVGGGGTIEGLSAGFMDAQGSAMPPWCLNTSHINMSSSTPFPWSPSFPWYTAGPFAFYQPQACFPWIAQDPEVSSEGVLWETLVPLPPCKP